MPPPAVLGLVPVKPDKHQKVGFHNNPTYCSQEDKGDDATPTKAAKGAAQTSDEDNVATGFSGSLAITKFPAELQLIIWIEHIKTPACHTFKVSKTKTKTETEDGVSWSLDVEALKFQHDRSAYRQWANMIKMGGAAAKAFGLCKRIMGDFRVISVKKTIIEEGTAAMDAANDLVIFKFQRQGTERDKITFHWFEHMGPNQSMDLDKIRKGMKAYKKIALHYNHKQPGAADDGPFQCYCDGQPCSNYKACPHALACFLDCFPNLEEFYFIVEPSGFRNRRWVQKYRSKPEQTPTS